jgi:hypothetical protein
MADRAQPLDSLADDRFVSRDVAGLQPQLQAGDIARLQRLAEPVGKRRQIDLRRRYEIQPGANGQAFP